MFSQISSLRSLSPETWAAIAASSLALTDRLTANHNELLATLARQGDTFERRLDQLETNLARLDAVLQVIATNLCEFLTETDPATLRESLLSDADKFTRFVNAMVRLAEGGIKCDRHSFQAQERADQFAKHFTQKPGISEEALREAEEKLKLL